MFWKKFSQVIYETTMHHGLLHCFATEVFEMSEQSAVNKTCGTKSSVSFVFSENIVLFWFITRWMYYALPIVL